MEKIAVDAMGGDNAPEQIVIGAIDAVKADKDLSVVLVGKKNDIDAVLAETDGNFDKNRVEIVDAQDVITNDESPTMAIKTKKESSLVKSFDLLMSDENAGGFVSAGSTGAVLVGAFMKVGRIKGVSRPALAPVLPTLKGNGVVLCDCGANVDCKPINLQHFAIMASAYAEAMLGVKNARVGLLNNGAEAHKGNELTQETYKLLSQTEGINFVGNCERATFFRAIMTWLLPTVSTATSLSNRQKARQKPCFHSSKKACTAVDCAPKSAHCCSNPCSRACKRRWTTTLTAEHVSLA